MPYCNRLHLVEMGRGWRLLMDLVFESPLRVVAMAVFQLSRYLGYRVGGGGVCAGVFMAFDLLQG
jgi:hypothetical protein